MAHPPYTLLAIDNIDFSQYAVRGITMTLEPIDQAANVARDCRGFLADISVAQFRQYKVSITCTDHEAPVLDDVWPGQDVTITCIPGLSAASDVLTIPAKVTIWNTSRDEWGAEVAWQLNAEQNAPGTMVWTPGGDVPPEPAAFATRTYFHIAGQY